VLLVLELLHLDHFGEAVQAFDERILDRLAHAARERHELRRVELLVAEEHDLVLQECVSNGFFIKAIRKIDADDFGAERSGDLANFYCSTLMFWALMIWP
jgi:hypothetical protein